MATSKTKKGFARAAISAALTGALALGGALAPVAAWANTVTIYGADNNPIAANDTMKAVYKKAVLVFKADKIDNSQNEAGGLATESESQKIAWGSTGGDTSVKTLVSAFLQKDKAQTGAGQDYLDWLKEKNYITGDNTAKTSYAGLDDAGQAVFDNPRYAAAYIGQEIAKANAAGTPYVTNTTDPNVPNITGSTSFADKLATALATAAGDDVVFSASNEGNLTFSLTQTGYYVLMGETATSARPIWLPFNSADGDLDIYGKSSIPTLEKFAAEGKDTYEDADFQKTVDAGNDEQVTFKLKAIVPAGTYDKLEFTDILPAQGFAHDAVPTVTVKSKIGDAEEETLEASAYTVSNSLQKIDADGADIATDDTTTPVAGYKLTVKMKGNTANATNSDEYTASAETVITVTYSVALTNDATMGADELNTNTAKLSYGTQQQYSNEATASAATFQLKIKKVNSVTGEALTGADFTIKDTNGTADDTDDKYLKKGTNAYEGDGTFAVASAGASDYTFTVNPSDDAAKKGTIDVTRVDGSTFLISETKAPAGKAPIENFTVTITPEFDAVSGEVTALNAEAKGVKEDATSASVEVDAATGLVTITVPNGDEEIRLPVTGMTPSQLGTVAGVVLVAVGAFVVVRRRNSDEA